MEAWRGAEAGGGGIEREQGGRKESGQVRAEREGEYKRRGAERERGEGGGE